MSNINPSYSQRNYDNLLDELAELHLDKPAIDSKIIEKLKLLETYTIGTNRFFCLFCQVDFFPIYISATLEQNLGYTPQEILQKGLLAFFKIVYWKQIPMAVKVHQWEKRFQQIMGDKFPLENRETFFCGVKFKHKTGKIKTYMFKQKMLAVRNKHPTLSFIEIEDISSHFKEDFVWGRLTAQHENQLYARVFFQVGKKTEYEDLLSARELEILKLAMKQKSNVEISELLGISKNTVERHRKNMIARVGVTDMTALIYICKLCKLI